MSESQEPNENASGADARRYWAGNLDPQNLERAGGTPPGLSVEREIAFAATPDVEFALRWLGGAVAHGDERTIVDLGAGLGAHSFLFARRGWRVVAVDSSGERLAALAERAASAGCADRIETVVAPAEALPFRDGTVAAIFTKSVLIHTDLPRASAEIARVLSPGGRAALLEPRRLNPFVRLYRATLAPKEWKGITRYFGPEEDRLVSERLRDFGRAIPWRPFYLFGFLAFAFQFAAPNPHLFRAALVPLHALDRLLFFLFPPLRAFAWFGAIALERDTFARVPVRGRNEAFRKLPLGAPATVRPPLRRGR